MRLRLTHCVNTYWIVKLTYSPIQVMCKINTVHQNWFFQLLILTSLSSVFVTLNTNAMSASLGSAWNEALTLV